MPILLLVRRLQAALPSNPRYLQMLEDVLKTPERMIGIMQKRDDGSLAAVGGRGSRYRLCRDRGRALHDHPVGGVAKAPASSRLEDGFTPIAGAASIGRGSSATARARSKPTLA